jgi:hypothetical protein
MAMQDRSDLEGQTDFRAAIVAGELDTVEYQFEEGGAGGIWSVGDV